MSAGDDRFQLGTLLRTRWNPRPLDPPSVDSKLESLSALARSAESLRYGILTTEFWLSPQGQVREWLRSHTRAAVLLASPAFLVMPIVTFILWQFATWMALLVGIWGKLIIFPILLLLAALSFYVAWQSLRAVFGRR